MTSTMRVKIKNVLLTAGSLVLLVLLWHISAIAVNGKLLFPIPTPIETLKEFFVCVKLISFWKSVLNSIWHIVLGFVFAVVLGLLGGILSGNNKFFKTLASPISRLIRSVPVAAIIVVAWLWVPSSVMPSLIVFLMVFPICWLQVETALLSIDYKLIEMAKVFGMSKTDIQKNIKIPAVLPAFRNACISGLGFAWKSGVAAEVICNPTGSLGAMLSNAKSNLEYEKVFAIILTIVILSLLLENIIKFFWKERRYD